MSVGSDVADELLKGPAAPASGGVGASVAEDMLAKFPQSMSANRQGMDKTQVPDIADDTKKAVPLFTVLKASIFPDIEKKLDYLSQETGIERARWGVVDGNIVYADPETNRYVRAIPSVSKAKGAIDLWQRATKWAADQVGPSVPGAAGAAVGTVMGPTGMSIPAAATTAALTDVGRQTIGNLMLDGDQTDIDWLNSVGQGLLAGGGQAIPAGLIRGASRNPMKISPYDRTQAMDPTTLATAQQAQQEAKGQGVDLTFGQATNLRSALSGERQLARDPASMDTMDKTYKGQREQIGSAATKFADSISTVQTVDEGVNAMRGGAQATIKGARAERSAAAKPEYDKALAQAIPDDELKTLRGDAVVDEAIKYVRSNTAYSRDIKDLPDTSLKVLDLAKRRIDDQINAAERAGNGNEARLLTGAKNDLLGKLDELVPDYKPAREAFAGKSPAVDELESGVVGTLANKEGVERIGEIRNLFNANLSNPAAIGKARQAYEKAGKADQWNAGVATYLRDALDAASKTDKGLSAQRLVTSVYGDERQKALLKEAMTPDQFDGFTRLMNVVQHVARTMPEGSATATDTAGGQALRAQFGKPVKMAKDAANLNFGNALFDRMTLRMSDSGMEKLAKAVTDPNNVEQLKKLRMLDPRHEKAVIAASQLLGIPTAVGATGMRDPSDREPTMPGQE